MNKLLGFLLVTILALFFGGAPWAVLYAVFQNTPFTLGTGFLAVFPAVISWIWSTLVAYIWGFSVLAIATSRRVW